MRAKPVSMLLVTAQVLAQLHFGADTGRYGYAIVSIVSHCMLTTAQTEITLYVIAD
jgi:hypothetical protein